MKLRNHLAGLAVAAALASAGATAQAACMPARTGPGVAALSETWHRAIEALIWASATEGHPWSCTGGTVDLRVHDGGATLTVTDVDSRAIAREVASPDEIEPLGEALLAKPVAPVGLQAAPSPAPYTPPEPRGDQPPAAPYVPRALVSALVAPRYAGRSNLVWGGVTVGAALPFGAWSAGAWGRYDGPSVVLGDHRESLSEVCLGASLSRSFALAPLELRASFTPSVAVVTRSLGRLHGDETRVDGRLGVEARGVLPITTLVRAVVALDGELAPNELGVDSRPPPPHDPTSDFPAYTLGIGLGVELTPR